MVDLTCKICGGEMILSRDGTTATCRFCNSTVSLTPKAETPSPKASIETTPFTPYEGNEPYIFISYAHKDTARVLPILNALSAKGFRIWYDAGIEAGTEWPDYIAEHLEKASCFLAFLSESSLASKNCRQEINYAMDLDVSMMIVHLEPLTLTGGLRMRLGLVQAIFYHRHSSLDFFVEELVKARELQSCRGQITPTFTPIPVPTPIPTPTPVPTPAPEITVPDTPLSEFDIRGDVLVKYKGNRRSVKVPSGVREIAKYAFSGTSVVTVIIPNSVTTIGYRAFSGCSSLKTVVLPNTLTDVTASLFEKCTALEEITLPESVKTIAEYAFSDCTSLSRVTVGQALRTIERRAFQNCAKLKTITLPKTTEIGYQAFLNTVITRI